MNKLMNLTIDELWDQVTDVIMLGSDVEGTADQAFPGAVNALLAVLDEYALISSVDLAKQRVLNEGRDLLYDYDNESYNEIFEACADMAFSKFDFYLKVCPL